MAKKLVNTYRKNIKSLFLSLLLLTCGLVVTSLIGVSPVAAQPPVLPPAAEPNLPIRPVQLPDGQTGLPGDPSTVTQTQGPDGFGRQTNIAIVLDASGSMNVNLPGTVQTRLEGAKNSVNTFISTLPADTQVSFWTFGHRVEQEAKEASCQDIEEIVPFETIDPARFAQALDGITAIGYTPIAETLRQIASSFPVGEDQINAIILISDGEETCDGDPCAIAQSLFESTARITVHTINYAGNEAVQTQLQCIANASKGSFYQAPDAPALTKALEKIRTTLSPLSIVRLEVGGVNVEARRTQQIAGREQPIQYRLYPSGASQPSMEAIPWVDTPVSPGVYDLVVNTAPPVMYAGLTVEPETQLLIRLKLGMLEVVQPAGTAPTESVTVVHEALSMPLGQVRADTMPATFTLLPGVYAMVDDTGMAVQRVDITPGQKASVTFEPRQPAPEPSPEPTEFPTEPEPAALGKEISLPGPNLSTPSIKNPLPTLEAFKGTLGAFVVALVLALGITLFFLGFLRYVADQNIVPDERIAAELARQQGVTPLPNQEEEDNTFFLLKLISEAVADRDFTDELAHELLRADLKLTVPEYLLIRAAVVLLGFILGILASGNPIPGAILAVVGFFLPPFYVRRRISKRQEAFNKQLEDVLTLLVGSLRAGYGLLQALNVVVEEIPSPAADEFKRVIQEVGLGLSLQEALENLVERIESDDLDMIVTAITIQQQVGGNLADILETISETIRERVRILGEIRVLTSQQRLTGLILALLPFFLGVAIFFLNRDYISELFKPGPILVIPATAVFLEFIGFLVIRKIVDIKV